ncbi:hypothetical protein BOX15_Mlig016567g1 [Macrostomum lignano]|uniref:VWFD domain-containing protein n=1 Tax=Macrostomum lignano TaxID=282301 RepID=A0A267DV57_9PLAT|nr:hypothetical protein BOX15_Mlig016567g1 [Macrostomum lignano]
MPSLLREMNPSKRKFCTCTSSGDPHYHTFDGKWISFQGKCKYLLAQSKLKKGSKCNFKVTAKNEARGRTGRVSWTRFVDISFHGINVRLHQRRRVFINGKRVRRLPISLYPGGKKIRIYHSGRNVVAESKYCGMHLQFNGQSVAELHLPRSRYASKVQGICGNCNGNPSDDLKTRDGKDVSKLGIHGFVKIGQSFAVPDDSSKKYRCKVKPVLPPSKVCSAAMRKAVKSKKYCGMIIDKSGPFGSCLRSKKVDYSGIFENCRFDVCEYKSPRNRRRAVCQSLESLYNACLAAGFSVSWRSRSFCPMRCGPNAVYSQKASGCPRTCSDIGRRRVCRLPSRDACVCKPGFV